MEKSWKINVEKEGAPWVLCQNLASKQKVMYATFLQHSIVFCCV